MIIESSDGKERVVLDRDEFNTFFLGWMWKSAYSGLSDKEINAISDYYFRELISNAAKSEYQFKTIVVEMQEQLLPESAEKLEDAIVNTAEDYGGGTMYSGMTGNSTNFNSCVSVCRECYLAHRGTVKLIPDSLGKMLCPVCASIVAIESALDMEE